MSSILANPLHKTSAIDRKFGMPDVLGWHEVVRSGIRGRVLARRFICDGESFRWCGSGGLVSQRIARLRSVQGFACRKDESSGLACCS